MMGRERVPKKYNSFKSIPTSPTTARMQPATQPAEGEAGWLQNKFNRVVMDDLISTLGESFAVSNIPNNPAAPHPRFVDYKIRNKKFDQDARRAQLLEQQKRKRDELYNSSRRLQDPGDDSDFETPASHVAGISSDMEFSGTPLAKTKQKKQQQLEASSSYKNRLMFSEWLVEVPTDFADIWYVMPCPEGRRTTLIAERGMTHAYSKSGSCLASFRSALPGGHRGSSGCTELDCIWSAVDHSYYVLDVMAWNTISLLDCETDFRFFWLKSKLSEISDVSSRSSRNAFPIRLLQFCAATRENLCRLGAAHPLFPGDVPRVDGLLFYHARTHYTPGHTPLVGWLKPHMLPTVLGVPVAPPYAVAPPVPAKKKRGKVAPNGEFECGDMDVEGAACLEQPVEAMQ